MWIASKLGFFSIVRKEGSWHVRGRVKNDLGNLQKTAGIKAPIEDWHFADYRWRMRVQEADLGAVFRALEASVDYPNFKSEIAASAEQRSKLGPYHDFWAALMQIQSREGVGK